MIGEGVGVKFGGRGFFGGGGSFTQVWRGAELWVVGEMMQSHQSSVISRDGSMTVLAIPHPPF